MRKPHPSFRLLKHLIMRKIDSIIIHCSATKVGRDFSASDIGRWHRERGFDCIGYHYVIRLDGKIEKGRSVAVPGAHCMGWNAHSIGICYVGGLDANGQPADTRTNAQKRVLYQFIQDLQREYPSITLVMGHRDTSPDRNGNGVVEPCEYVKACPCFDVGEFLHTGRSMLYTFAAIFVFPLLFSACRSSKSFERRDIETDSVTAVVRKASSETALQSVTEKEEEHIEQTVFVFGGDTPVCASGQMKMHPYVKVVRTVVKKRSNTEAQIAEERQMVAVDSVQRVYKQEDMKEESYSRKSRWRLWIIVGVLVAIKGVGMWRNKVS